MLFYNRTIHEIEKFSLKEKIGGYLSDSFLHVTKKKEKERTFVFWRSREKKVSLYAIHISFTRVYS